MIDGRPWIDQRRPSPLNEGFSRGGGLAPTLGGLPLTLYQFGTSPVLVAISPTTCDNCSLQAANLIATDEIVDSCCLCGEILWAKVY